MNFELLTKEEHEVVKRLGELLGDIAYVINNSTDDRSNASVKVADLQEATHHIHALQNMVLAQAAARRYPDRYRLLGSSIGAKKTISEYVCEADYCESAKKVAEADKKVVWMSSQNSTTENEKTKTCTVKDNIRTMRRLQYLGELEADWQRKLEGESEMVPNSPEYLIRDSKLTWWQRCCLRAWWRWRLLKVKLSTK